MAIPASNIVEITPRVLAGTGTDLTFNGLFLTESSTLPAHTLKPFYNAQEAANFFGADSSEYTAAQAYFNGFDNSDTKPTLCYFYRRAAAPSAAFVRSGTFDRTQAQILATLNGISAGTFTVTMNGNERTLNGLDFTGASSLSAAANILQQQLRTVKVEDKAASNQYATAVLPGAGGNDLSIRIEQGEPEEKTPAKAASCKYGTAVAAGAAGNALSIAVTAGEPEESPAVAASSEIGTAVTAGAAGNNITVEVSTESQEVTPAKAAGCKYASANTAGAAGNEISIAITANGTTPANFDITVTGGGSSFSQQNVTAGSTTDNLNPGDVFTWTPGVALTVETVQMSGGADAVTKDVYTVVTKNGGSTEDTQEELETPAQLTDNAFVNFKKELEAFAVKTYTFTGGADGSSTPTFNVETLNGGERADFQEGVKTAAELTDNDLISFNREADLSVETVQLEGGADAVQAETFNYVTVQAGLDVDAQNGLQSPEELQNNSYVNFNKETLPMPGIYPLSGGSDGGAAAWEGATVTFASNLNAFTFTSGATGAASSIAGCAGDVAEAFYFTEAQGAVYSEGEDVRSLTETMNSAIELGQNFVSFGSIEQLNDEEILELAQWSNSMYSSGTQFLFVFNSTDPALTVTGQTNIASQLQELNVNGTAGIYGDLRYAAFIMGAIASINWDGNNSTITLAFKAQAGLEANVKAQSASSALEGYSMNFVGDYASRNDAFILLYPGCMFGQWKWVDSYIGSIWLANALQVQIVAGLQTVKRVPYNETGYTFIRAWCADVIQRALTNGVISTGVNLSQTQKTELQQDAGRDISEELYSNGYYVQILDATAQIRQERRSPTCGIWYTDAGSVHRISMPVTTVQ